MSNAIKLPLFAGAAFLALGLLFASGVVQTLVNMLGWALLLGGVALAVVGGASLLFDVIVNRAAGAAALLGGIVLAVVGFFLQWTIISWAISAAGYALIIAGAALIIVAVIGMFTAYRRNSNQYYG